jgi:flagellar biosynthesis/type III secretory pathway protein FliH
LRTELEGITMDVKKFFADLAAMYRKPSEPTPQGAAAGIDAAHEVRLQAGYEAGHAEGYEAG